MRSVGSESPGCLSVRQVQRTQYLEGANEALLAPVLVVHMGELVVERLVEVGETAAAIARHRERVAGHHATLVPVVEVLREVEPDGGEQGGHAAENQDQGHAATAPSQPNRQFQGK